MEKRYKLTLFNKNLYKEVELSAEMAKVKIGTTVGCDVRLHKYFDDFEMTLELQDGKWIVTASDNIYFNFHNNSKKLTAPLHHGDVFHVRYEKADLFSCRFLLDFDYEKKNYDLMVDISKTPSVTIGAGGSHNIVLNSPYVTNDSIVLQQTKSGLLLQCRQSKYGVLHNGKPVSGEVQLRDYDFFSIADFSFYYKKGRLYCSATAEIQFNGLAPVNVGAENRTLIYPKFNRSARMKVALNEEEIHLLSPNEKPQKPKSNLLLKLLPALTMIALTIGIRGFMGGSNMTFILFSVCSMTMGALVSVFSIISEKKEYKTEVAKRESDYTAYIEKKRAEIIDARKQEETALNQIYYPYSVTSTFVKRFSGDLYDRIPEDEDFLDVRIGVGSVDSVRKIAYKPHETYESAEDSLVDLPLKLAEEFESLPVAPIVVHLKEANVVGVVGSRALQYEMLKIMFFDLCVRQYFHDVELFLFVQKDEMHRFQWTRWYKHLKNEETGVRNIVCDDESKTGIFEYLYAEFSRREASKNKTHLPHIVVFVTHDYGIQQHPLSKYIQKASELGGTFIFFENNKEYIPVGCSQLLMMENEQQGQLLCTSDRSNVTKFTYTKIEDAEMSILSHKMAPVYCEEISLEGSLTKNITLYQLMNIVAASDLNLGEIWKSSDVTKTMAAPLGVRAGNELVYLNIHDGESAHGPHGLVAGTTGSGKSELLQTYILAMAVMYHPYEVAFLIIDFKGGGMGNQFKDLPHTLGVITNIDGKEIYRSLVSIKAEIVKRQRLFKEAGVDHIDKYIRAYKSGKVSVAMPHLIIVVDEFAELKAAHRDFMDELISAARIGRTLGVHLILATQKPKGQVDDQIWSNAKFRLCLKVQTPEDSNEVIKTPLAAEIKEAGRAYLMVGNNEIFELFQSAYSGASVNAEELNNQKEFVVSTVDFAGRRNVVYHRKREKKAVSGEAISQKDAIMTLVETYCREQRIPKLPDICQPPLQKLIGYAPTPRDAESTEVLVHLGVYDDPTQQIQEQYSVDIATTHMLLIGALQTGKTNLLQLILRDLSERYTPEEVNFYIIDFSSMVLTNFQGLAHVGGVVCPNEDEKMNNLFKLLTQEMAKRKQKIKAAGVSSFTAYRESGMRDLSLIVLLIDNFASLKELYLSDNPVLLALLRDGLSVGISIVVANGSVKGIDYRYMSSFATKLCLYHNNSDEFSTLFGSSKLGVDAIPGRSIVCVEKANLECQTYLSFEGEKEHQRVEKIKAFISETNARYPGMKAQMIPEIPEFLLESAVRSQYASSFGDYRIILGFDYDTLLPKVMDMSRANLIISGTPKSGKGNFVKYLVSCLAKQHDKHPVQIVIFDKATVKKFQSLAQAHDCVRYEMTGTNMSALCKEWKTELERRKKLVLENGGDLEILKDEPLLMMICEDSGKEMLSGFDEALFEYSDYKFAWIASNTENEDISPMKSPKLYKAKSAGAGCMLFGSVAASKMFDSFIKIPISEKRERLSGEVTPGDAFYVAADDPTSVFRLKTVIHTK